MIDCSGLVVIPEAHGLKEIETSSGYYLDFNVMSQERGKNKEIVYHKYRANMWVSKEDINEWREKLVPRRVLKFAAGQWSAVAKEDNKYPMNVLKLDSRRVIPLNKPLWAEEEG